MKKILLLSAFLLLIIVGVAFTQKYLNGEKTLSLFKKTPIVKIGDRIFQVAVAASQQKREIGLSEIKSLPQNQGMIFLFEKPDYFAFWMKNMKLPIDIIYIKNDQIVTILNNVQPVKTEENPTIYTPTEPSDKVLEINAGLAQKYDFKKGDKIKYENFGNRNQL